MSARRPAPRRTLHRALLEALLGALLCAVLAAGAGRLAAQVTPPPAPATPTPPAAPGAPSAPGTTAGANSDSAALAESGSKLTAYYAVPEMPASTILGATPAAITRPVTPKDFATSLIDGIDANGHARQGLAIEASLGLFRAFRVPLTTYQRSRRARFWSNFLVSFATVRVASDTQSTDLAWGVRAPLWDDGDPLARPEYTARLGDALRACAPDAPPDFIPRIRPGEAPEQFQARQDSVFRSPEYQAWRTRARQQQLGCLEGAATRTSKAAADSLWNARRLVVAYAGSARLTRSAFSDRRRLEDRVWAVGALPLSTIAGPVPIARASQIIGYLDYVRRRASDSAAATNGASFGTRLNVGSAAVNGFGEVLGEWRSTPPAGTRRTTAAFAGGLEFLAAPGTWISTGVGRRYSDAARADKTVLLANIRWGIARKPFLGSGPSSP